MNQDLHNIADLFKKALDLHSESPSDSVWENIDKNLDKKRVVSISKKYKKLKWVAAALLILSAGMAIYTWQTEMKNKELVKNIDNNNKQNLKGQSRKYKSKAEQIILNGSKITARDKASISVIEQINASQLKNGNEVFEQNKKKNLTERWPEQRLLKYKGSSARKEIENSVFKNNRNSFYTEQKNSLTNNIYTKGADLHKEVALETKLLRKYFNIDTTNFSLQKVLSAQNLKNRKMRQEKADFAVKNFRKNPSDKFATVTIFYSPDFVFSKVNNDHHDFIEEDSREIKKKEKIENSYTTGFLLDYKTGKKFSIASGLTFSSMTTNIQPKTIYARPDGQGNVNFRFNCSVGYSYIPAKSGSRPAIGDSLPALTSTNVLQYVGLPFQIKYDFNKGKFSLKPGVGIAVNFLTKGKIETAFHGISGQEKAKMNHIKGLSKAYVNGSLSLSTNYNLNQNLSVNIVPTARFGVTSINRDAPFKSYFNSLGLAAGLSVRL